MIDYSIWEPVIGLEIHVQLNTHSKLFSKAPNRFGDEPNTNITDVCTGQPGALPVLNKEAVRKAVQFGVAINSQIALFSRFDRKSYFYPDSPKNFQITQFEHPILKGGFVVADDKHFALNRAHLEEDAGTLRHFSNFAGVDYNRAGAPLLEIVSEACIHSPKDAVSYATAIKAIMEYIGASDCNMEEGSLRIDVNVSVRKIGEKTFRTKVEIKNMNSFHNMELALESEIRRQVRAYTLNEIVEKGTYRFDLEKKTTVLMRMKEEAEDYRYFPEPDLPSIILTPAYIDAIRSTLPELPAERYKRYITTYNLPIASALHLINEKALSDTFEEALKFSSNAKALCNWITVEFPGRLKETTKTIPPQHIAKLVNLIDSNVITGKIAKKVADEMLLHPGIDPEQIVRENPEYKPLEDTALVESFVNQVLAENPQSISDYKAGRTKAFGFLVGQVMKLCQGKANPSLVNELLEKKIKKD